MFKVCLIQMLKHFVFFNMWNTDLNLAPNILEGHQNMTSKELIKWAAQAIFREGKTDFQFLETGFQIPLNWFPNTSIQFF
jgi:hypothetical protein